MTTKPESTGTPASEVIAKLEAKLQAALDARGLRRCQKCRTGILKPEVRDVDIVHQLRSTTVRNIHGNFCAQCGEIEFDPSTDSARRFARACDTLVFRSRAEEKWRSLYPKYGLPRDGLARSFWNAMREAWHGYFAPLHMGAWLLKYPFTQPRIKSRLHKVSVRAYTVMALWNSDTNVWVAWSPDVPGLMTEAQTLSELSHELQTMVPELLAAHGLPHENVEIVVAVTQFEDRYPRDDGPLNEQQIAALRADVDKNFPRGKLISRKNLFS